MSLDVELAGLMRRHGDLLLARRFCVFLLWTPLVTIPLTILIHSALLGTEGLSQRSYADVVMFHLPGVLNLYPVYRLAQLGRVNRTLLLPGMLGVLSYAWPQLAWSFHIAGWRSASPTLDGPFAIYGAAFLSGFYSFVIWCLTLSVHRAYREM